MALLSDPQIPLLLLLLCAAGAAAGITSGLFGNGGGFVVVPALLLVFPIFSVAEDTLMYIAIGTSLATIVVSSARSVQAHSKQGAVDFSILRSWSTWLLVGVAAGLWIASKVDARSLIIIFAVGVLVYSAYFLYPKALSRLRQQHHMPQGWAKASLASFLGGFSALLGIGGGTVTVITMVLCQRTIHQAVATAAGVGFIIGLPGALGFIWMGWGQPDLPWGSIGYLHLPAFLAICAISIFTAPLGARLAHMLDENHLKQLFGIYLVIVSCSMFYKGMSG